MSTPPGAIVDAHYHLWHLSEGHFPWLQDGYDAAAFFLGDYGSLRTWLAQGLAAPDLVHFTNKGYDLQGLLLYLALQDGFAAHPLR